MDIEVPIDDELFERATRYTRARGTTVEQLIREFLTNFAREDPRQADTQSR